MNETATLCTVPRWWLEEVERVLADHGEYRLRTEAQAALHLASQGGSRADDMLTEEAFARIAEARQKYGSTQGGSNG
jgi:hypothetical protein